MLKKRKRRFTDVEIKTCLKHYEPYFWCKISREPTIVCIINAGFYRHRIGPHSTTRQDWRAVNLKTGRDVRIIAGRLWQRASRAQAYLHDKLWKRQREAEAK